VGQKNLLSIGWGEVPGEGGTIGGYRVSGLQNKREKRGKISEKEPDQSGLNSGKRQKKKDLKHDTPQATPGTAFGKDD